MQIDWHTADTAVFDVRSSVVAVFARRKVILAERAQSQLERGHQPGERIDLSAGKQLVDLLAVTKVCPRIADPNIECPLCGAIDDKNHHRNPDRPRECSAAVRVAS